MQSGSDSYGNGWHILDDSMLHDRFGVPYPYSGKFDGPVIKGSSLLIDVESLGQSEEFLSLLSYINTPESEQRKGRSGYVK